METISKRLKSTLQKEMEIDKIYKNEEIRRLIFEKTGMRYGADYMETHFTGCLCALRKSGDIVQVQRGEYKRVDSESAARRGEQARRGEPEGKCLSERCGAEYHALLRYAGGGYPVYAKAQGTDQKAGRV